MWITIQDVIENWAKQIRDEVDKHIVEEIKQIICLQHSGIKVISMKEDEYADN